MSSEQKYAGKFSGSHKLHLLRSILFNFPLYILCFCLSALVSICWYFPSVSIFSFALWLPSHRSLHLSLSPVPKHRHLSLSFRSPLCSPKGATVWEFGGRARLVSAGKPLLFIWPSALREINRGGQIISDITDDMWKHSIVKTLEKTCLHQSLRIRERDKKGSEGRKMDSRNRCNPRLSAFGSLWQR